MGSIQQNQRTGEVTGATFSFVGMNNVTDPAYLDLTKGECELLVNVDPNNRGGFVTRKGYTQVNALSTHSGWGNGIDAYYVSEAILYHFDGTTSTAVTILNSDSRVVFEQVNDVVAFWSVTDKGILRGRTLIPQEIPKGKFKIPSPCGHMITYFNGRLYIANGSDLYCTDSFDPTLNKCDERRYLVFSLDSAITLLAFVDDGIYVGSSKEIAFLNGTDPYGSGFKVERVSNYGAIPHTAIKTTGSYVPASQLTGSIVIFTSEHGICVGGNGGNLINLSLNVFSFPQAENGCAFLREQNGLYHYVTRLSSDTPSNVYTKPLIDVDQADV